MNDEQLHDERVVRPFILTGGRTSTKVPPEAVVAATPFQAAAIDALDTEARQILDLARNPCAVVEIAAVLSLPIQVTMILVGDLTDRGALHVLQHPHATPDPHLVERLIHGISRL